MQLADYQAFVIRREPYAGRDYYAVLENERVDVRQSNHESPIPPAQSEAAGPTRRSRTQVAFFFHRHNAVQEMIGHTRMRDIFGHPSQRGRLGADFPLGTEQQLIAQRINIARRPAKPYGNRHVLRTRPIEIPAELKKEYLHVPLWAWIVGLAGGVIVGIYLRRRSLANAGTDNTTDAATDVAPDPASDGTDDTFFPAADAPGPIGSDGGGTGTGSDPNNPSDFPDIPDDVPGPTPNETPAGSDTPPPAPNPSSDPNQGGGGPPAAPPPAARIAAPARAVQPTAKQQKAAAGSIKGKTSGQTVKQAAAAAAKTEIPHSSLPSEKRVATGGSPPNANTNNHLPPAKGKTAAPVHQPVAPPRAAPAKAVQHTPPPPPPPPPRRPPPPPPPPPPKSKAKTKGR
jgi:hypothetical protein